MLKKSRVRGRVCQTAEPCNRQGLRGAEPGCQVGFDILNRHLSHWSLGLKPNIPAILLIINDKGQCDLLYDIDSILLGGMGGQES